MTLPDCRHPWRIRGGRENDGAREREREREREGEERDRERERQIEREGEREREREEGGGERLSAGRLRSREGVTARDHLSTVCFRRQKYACLGAAQMSP